MMRDFLVLGATVGVCVGSLFLVVNIGKFFGVRPQDLHGPTFVFSPASMVLVVFALLFPVEIIFGARAWGFGPGGLDLGFTRSPFAYTIGGFFFGLFIQGMNYGLKYWATRGGEFHFSIPAGTPLGRWAGYFSWFLICLILNSICEELVYRVFPISVIGKYPVNPTLFVVGISLLFSLIHFLTSEASVANLLFRTLYGILLCILYLRTRSFWFVTGIHTGTNLMASFFSDQWKMGGVFDIVWKTRSHFPEYSFSVILLAGILIQMLF